MDYISFLSSFWRDKYVRGLPHESKLLYIYLLTNKAVQLTGIYEFLIEDCILFTGLEPAEAQAGLLKLRQIPKTGLPKIVLSGDYIFVTSILRKSFNLPHRILSGSIKTYAIKSFGVGNIPSELISYFYQVYGEYMPKPVTEWPEVELINNDGKPVLEVV